MSKINFYEGTTVPNFIASETGLIQKTRNFSDVGVVLNEDNRKVIPAGTIWPSNDEEAEGIVYTDVDVTWGVREGSLLIAGRVFQNCLQEVPDAAAIAALEARGLYFDTMADADRSGVE